jgi:hypothetical protein
MLSPSQKWIVVRNSGPDVSDAREEGHEASTSWRNTLLLRCCRCKPTRTLCGIAERGYPIPMVGTQKKVSRFADDGA